MCEIEHGDNPEQGALRGQEVSFFSELECWLIAAVRHLDGGLDQDENKILLKAAKVGLKCCNEADTSASIAEDKGT